MATQTLTILKEGKNTGAVQEDKDKMRDVLRNHCSMLQRRATADEMIALLLYNQREFACLPLFGPVEEQVMGWPCKGFPQDECFSKIKSANRKIWIQDVSLSSFGNLSVLFDLLIKQKKAASHLDVRVMICDADSRFADLHPNVNEFRQRFEQIVQYNKTFTDSDCQLRFYQGVMYGSMICVDDFMFSIRFLEGKRSKDCFCTWGPYQAYPEFRSRQEHFEELWEKSLKIMKSLPSVDASKVLANFKPTLFPEPCDVDDGDAEDDEFPCIEDAFATQSPSWSQEKTKKFKTK